MENFFKHHFWLSWCFQEVPTNGKSFKWQKKTLHQKLFQPFEVHESQFQLQSNLAPTFHEFQFFLIHFWILFRAKQHFYIPKCQLIMMAIQTNSIKYSFRQKKKQTTFQPNCRILPNCSSKQCQIFFVTFTRCIDFWSHLYEINEPEFHILIEFCNYFVAQIWLFDNNFLLNNSWKYVNKSFVKLTQNVFHLWWQNEQSTKICFTGDFL